MKLNQLRIFDSVARHRNVTNAAKELHMSQPAVSLQLKALQQEYGASFYVKNNHGIELTATGRSFLHAIRPILSQVEKVDFEFKHHKNKRDTNSLLIGGNNTLCATVFPKVLVAYRDTCPDVELTIETADSHTIERGLLDGTLEVALITNPSYAPTAVYEAYESHQAVAFVHPHHPLAGRLMSLEELVRHPLIVKKGSTCIEKIRKRGYDLRPPLQCNSAEAAKLAVENGLGVGLLFAARVAAEVARGDLKEIVVPELKEITHESFIVYSRHKPLSRCAEDFIGTLRRMRTLPPSYAH